MSTEGTAAEEKHCESDLKYEKWPLNPDPSLFNLDAEESTFFGNWTGIKGEEELKKHIQGHHGLILSRPHSFKLRGPVIARIQLC